MCIRDRSLVFTLAVTAANLRLTYVTDSDGARQLVVSSETCLLYTSLCGGQAREFLGYRCFGGGVVPQ